MTALRELALKYGTDKAGGRDNPDRHEYCEAYEFFLGPMRHKKFTMVEIGVGGYHFIDRGGEGLRMWREYFSKARIHGVDLHLKSLVIPGVTIWCGSQDDPVFLKDLIAKVGPVDVIIDDASHLNPLTLKTFEICFPLLAPGGLYVIEDVHSSYWHEEGFGGGDHPDTVMNFFKQQADGLNSYHLNGRLWLTHLPVPDIESIHFFKEIIFIRKKV